MFVFESQVWKTIFFLLSQKSKIKKNVKNLLKISFFCRIFLFSLVHSKQQIFLYHLWNFHSIISNRILFMHFLRKWRSNIYLNKKLLIKEIFKNHSDRFLVTLSSVQLFLNSRFLRTFIITVYMVWLKTKLLLV